MSGYYGYSTADVLLAVFCFAALVIFFAFKYSSYKKSEYYKSTQSPYLSTLLDKGRKGEYLTYQALNKIDGNKKLFFNCYVPKDTGETTEVDAILVHETGIYVCESKNYSGWIFGSENQREWTQVLPKGKGRSEKNKFFNPIIQNKVHIKWIKQYLEYDKEIKSYIVFSNRCTLKDVTLKSGDSNVLHRNELKSAIEQDIKIATLTLSVEEIEHISEKLIVLTNPEEAVKLKHIDNVKAKEFICPYCGGKLKMRTAKSGTNSGKQFWGCSNYPKCRYTRNLTI